MIKRPDTYEHNNPSLPIIDCNNTIAGFKVIENYADLLTIPSGKLVDGDHVYCNANDITYICVDNSAPEQASSWRIKANSLIEGTYQELQVLIDSSSLKTGSRYLLSNFKQKYIIEYSKSSDSQLTTDQGQKYIAGHAPGWSQPFQANPTDGSAFVFSDGNASAWNDSGRHFSGASAGIYTITGVTSGATASVTDSTWYNWTVTGASGTFVQGEEIIFNGPGFNVNSGISTGVTINDGSGRPLITPNGVLNTDVHDGAAYGDLSASENPTVPTERLILTATSPTAFNPLAYSLDNPNDTIYYDFTDNEIVVNGVTTQRNGFIKRRIDNLRKIDINADFRTERRRRWKLDTAHQSVKHKTYNSSFNATFGNGTDTIENSTVHRYVLPFPGFECGVNPTTIDITDVVNDSLDTITSSANYLQATSSSDLRDEFIINPDADAKDISFSSNAKNVVFTDTFINNVTISGLVTNFHITGYVSSLDISTGSEVVNTLICSSNFVGVNSCTIRGYLNKTFIGTFIVRSDIRNIDTSFISGGDNGSVNGLYYTNIDNMISSVLANGFADGRILNMAKTVMYSITGSNNDFLNVRSSYFGRDAYLNKVTISSAFDKVDMPALRVFETTFSGRFTSFLFGGTHQLRYKVFPITVVTGEVTSNADKITNNRNIVGYDSSNNNFIYLDFSGLTPSYSYLY